MTFLAERETLRLTSLLRFERTLRCRLVKSLTEFFFISQENPLDYRIEDIGTDSQHNHSAHCSVLLV